MAAPDSWKMVTMYIVWWQCRRIVFNLVYKKTKYFKKVCQFNECNERGGGNAQSLPQYYEENVTVCPQSWGISCLTPPPSLRTSYHKWKSPEVNRWNSICSSQVPDAREPDEGVGDADDGEGPPEPTAAERRPHPGQLRSHAGGRGHLGRRLGPDSIG